MAEKQISCWDKFNVTGTWVGALAACAATAVAFWGVQVAQRVEEKIFVLNKISPPFAIVSADGQIVKQDRLEPYKPTINLERHGDQDKDPEINWKYIIQLQKPATLIFSPQCGATPRKRELSATRYEIIFYSVGLGNPPVQCEFVMQVLEPSDKK